MVQIKQVEKDNKKIIEDVVDIHLKTFKGFFLTFLGRGFLRQLYSCYCKYRESGILVAISENENSTIGFLAYSGDLSGLYKFMLQHKWFAFAWYSLGAFLRKPMIFLRLIRAFLKPKESKRTETYMELSSIGVHPSEKGKGIGTLLMNEYKKSVDFSKYAYISLETDAIDNISANAFYKKNGFLLIRTYKTKEGRMMNEYRYRNEQ